MKSGDFDIPSSIDIRPMGKSGTNAYAQMGSSRARHDAPFALPSQFAST